MSVPSGQSPSTDMAVLDLDSADDKDRVTTDRSFRYLSDDTSVASTSYGLTEVDEFSERRPVYDNPLLPRDVIEDRSEIKPISYQSTGFFLFHFATGLDKLLMFVAIIAGLAAGVCLSAHMYLFGEVTDVFTQASNTTDIFGLISDESIQYVILSFSVFVLSALNMYLWCIVKARQLVRIREVLIQSLFTKDIDWFDQHRTNKIISDRISDIEVFGRGTGETLAMFVQWLSAILTLIINSLIQSVDVTGVILPYFPCIIFAAVGSFWISKTYIEREKEGENLVKMALIPTFENVRVISAFQSQEIESRRLFKKFRFARRMTFRKYLCVGIKNGSFWMLAFFTLATGGWYGSYLVLEGRVTPGGTMQAILGILMSAIFVGQVYPCLECILKAREATENLINVLDENPVINQKRKLGKDFPADVVDIIFSDVHFTYPSTPEKQVLNGFQLIINPKQTVALVGPTGNGTSSVHELILRFYDPIKGQVLINGTNLKEMKLYNLRRYVGVVSHEASLLAKSIADNIRLGHEAVTKEQIVKAAKLANAHEFIMKLPQGYNTVVGESGILLKDDEKIRISIARALVRNPKILLLDDVTSALNTASEQIVLEALEKAKKNRTTIITSHCLTNIQDADLIVAVEGGKVVERGTHEELMEFGGLYYEMWRVQSSLPKEKINDYIFEIESDYKTKKGYEGKRSWRLVYSLRKSVPSSESGVCQDWSPHDQWEDNVNEKVPGISFSLMKRLLKLNIPDWSYAVIGSLTSILVGLIGPLFALFIADFIYIFSLPSADDQYTARRNAAARLMVLGAFLAPINYLQNFCFAQVDSKLTLRMRDVLCKALLKQDIGYFDNSKNTRHRLVNIFLCDAVDINGATSLKLAMNLQAISCIIGAIVISFAYSWQLAFPVLGIFLPALIALSYFTGRLYSPGTSKTTKLQEIVEKMVLEAFANIKTLAILTKEEFFIRKCGDIFQLMYRKKMAESIKFAILFGLSEGIVYCAFAVAFSVGSYLVHHGMADYQSVYRIVGTVIIGSIMTGRICWNSPDFRRGKIAANRLFPFVEMVPTDSTNEEENKTLELCKGAVLFKNVIFNNPNNPEIFVLDNISLSIDSGESVAIVGANEDEKNAIVDLMERFYKPISGTIKLDNVDIQSRKLNWVRSQISIIKDESLFSDLSIAENILYGSTSDISEVIDICKVLNLHEILASLPKGYDTTLEDAELPFPRQRLVIARALVRDPPIVLVDCESLALTIPSEKEVKEMLFRVLVEKTAIFFSHRVSLVEDINKIVVIDKGSVAEIGSHDDLMAAEGIYCKLVHSQRNLKEQF